MTYQRSFWRKALDEARSPADVVATMRDFLATLTPPELARLPEDCRPGRIKVEDDVEYWTFRLAQLVSAPPARPADALLAQGILNVFLHAMARFNHLQIATI